MKPFLARERGRYALNNLYVGPEGSVATDGRRLALILPPKEKKGDQDGADVKLSKTEEGFLVPKNLIDVAKKMFQKFPRARQKWMKVDGKNVYREVDQARFRAERMDVVDLVADPRENGKVSAKIKRLEGEVDLKFDYPEGQFPSWQSVIADYFPEGKMVKTTTVGFDPAYMLEAMKLLVEVQKDRGDYGDQSVRMDVIDQNSPVFIWNRHAVVMVMPNDIETDPAKGDQAKFKETNFPFFACGMDLPAIKAESERKKAEEAKRKAEAEKKRKEEEAKKDAEAKK